MSILRPESRRAMDIAVEENWINVLRSVPHVCLFCPKLKLWQSSAPNPSIAARQFTALGKCSIHKLDKCPSRVDDVLHARMRDGLSSVTMISDLDYFDGPPVPDTNPTVLKNRVAYLATAALEKRGGHIGPSKSVNDIEGVPSVESVAMIPGNLADAIFADRNPSPEKPEDISRKAKPSPNQEVTPATWATW